MGLALAARPTAFVSQTIQCARSLCTVAASPRRDSYSISCGLPNPVCKITHQMNALSNAVIGEEEEEGLSVGLSSDLERRSGNGLFPSFWTRNCTGSELHTRRAPKHSLEAVFVANIGYLLDQPATFLTHDPNLPRRKSNLINEFFGLDYICICD